MALEDDSDEVDFYAIPRGDMDMGLSKTKILKNQKKERDANMMEVTKEIKKPEKNSRIAMLKQKGKNKRNRSQLRF